MAITLADFNKIWASTSPLTPYSFSDNNYKQGWNFIGSTPPARQMWDFLQKQNDEKSQYLFNSIKDKTMLLPDDLATTIPNGADLDDYKTAGTYRTTSASVTASLSNCPTSLGAIKLVVLYIGYGSSAYCMQTIYTSYHGVFVRNLNGVASAVTWTEWKRVAYAEDVLPLSGGTLTGMIKTTSVWSQYSSSFAKGDLPSTTLYPFYNAYYDNGGFEIKNRMLGVGGTIDTNGTVSMSLYAYKNESNSTTSASVFVSYPLSADARFVPYGDNALLLGSANSRWKQLYAGTATINTSDERLKDNIKAIPDEVLDAWGEVNWYQYQFKDSIEEKGETKARIHTGAIAQRIESVFESHNLDANRYGLLCYDEWDATPSQRDEDGNIVTPAQPAGNRYSLRYEEALCMEAAYQRRRADRLEERIEALEKLLMK